MKSPTELPIKMAEFLPLLQDETWCTSYAFYLRWPKWVYLPLLPNPSPGNKASEKPCLPNLWQTQLGYCRHADAQQ